MKKCLVFGSTSVAVIRPPPPHPPFGFNAGADGVDPFYQMESMSFVPECDTTVYLMRCST